MKRLLLSAAMLSAWLQVTDTASAELVDFNTAGVLDARFFHTATPPVAEADGVGIGPSRGLSVTGVTDSGYTLTSPSFNFANLGTTLSVSAFFKTAAGPFVTTGEDRIFECARRHE